MRMAFAATPVVAVLKSIWLVPRTRELTESLVGIKELLMVLAKWAKEFCEMEVKGKGEDEIEKSGRETLECHRLYAAPPRLFGSVMKLVIVVDTLAISASASGKQRRRHDDKIP